MLRAIRYALALTAFWFAGLTAAKADTITYDVTYNSLLGSNVTGSGYFTVNYTPGVVAATISNFYFQDTITSGKNVSTFTYGSGDLLTSTVGVFANGQLAELDIFTKAMLGTNSNLGYSNLTLLLNGNLDGTIGTRGGDFSGGIGTMAVAATPEPSSLLLLGTGLAGAFGVARRRWRA